MADLLIYAGPVADDAPLTRTGGVPLVPEGFAWPVCASCGGPMQFVAHLLLDHLRPRPGESPLPGGTVLAVFLCQNDPGVCEEWDPTAGANRALLLPGAGLCPAAPPPGEATLLPEASAAVVEPFDGLDYEESRAAWTGPLRHVLGQLGGEPTWLQDDETPVCGRCAGRMRLVAQLEEGHDRETSANFGGGGCGYAFACLACGEAAFLWQC